MREQSDRYEQRRPFVVVRELFGVGLTAENGDGAVVRVDRCPGWSTVWDDGGDG